MKRSLARLVFVSLLVCMLAASSIDAAAPWKGRTLTSVLEELRQRGLPLVWNSSVVAGLEVVEEPRSRRPRRALVEVLEVHRLALLAGPGGRLLVAPVETSETPATTLGRLRGVVVDLMGRPVTGVVVRVEKSDRLVSVDAQGRFDFTDLPPGPLVLEVLEGEAVLATQTLTVGIAAATELVVPVEKLPMSLERIEVVSHLSILEDDPISAVSLDRDAIESLPHFGDDPLRVVKNLPGVSSGDLTTDFQLRGGLADEVLYRLDGLELYEPFHLRDLNGLFSLFDPQLMAGIDLIAGNFPAEFGDRTAGVLDMRTRIPVTTGGNAGISLSNAWLGGGGSFDEGRGHWLASGRRGYLDLVLDLAAADEADNPAPRPQYWDAFGKLEYEVSQRNRVLFNSLVSQDRIGFHERELTFEGNVDNFTDVDTDYVDRYVWLRHQGVVSARIFSDTVFSIAQVDHDRKATGRDYARSGSLDEAFDVADRRQVDLVGLRQDWSFELGPGSRHLAQGGFEGRLFDVGYAYSDSIILEDPIDDPRFGAGIDVTSTRASFAGRHWSAYLSDRFRLGMRLVAEAGMRYDRQSVTDSDQVSPRLNLMLPLGRYGIVRAGWGHYFQSQKPHELEVQFGVSAFQPAQRGRHASVGWQKNLKAVGTVRVEVYDRLVDGAHSRYETLFDPFRPLPQFATGLILVAPERVEARGVDLYMSGSTVHSLSWFSSLSWSEAFDVVGGVNQPRYFDQRFAATASLTWRPAARWTLAPVVRYHSGWPTTPISATASFASGQRTLSYDIGPFYSSRLPDYLSLDLRVSRRTVTRRGTFSVFLDLQNVLDRDNARGIDIEDPDFYDCLGSDCSVGFEQTTWLGWLPSLGISFEF